MKIKKINENAVVPTYGSEHSAGMDLYSCDEYEIAPGGMVKIHTGIAAAIPNGYFGGLYARSGIATKRGLRPANCVGVVDADYRGEVIVPLYNDSDETQVINRGERVAQLIIQPYIRAQFDVVDELDNTERGAGGFGHTGV